MLRYVNKTDCGTESYRFNELGLVIEMGSKSDRRYSLGVPPSEVNGYCVLWHPANVRGSQLTDTVIAETLYYSDSERFYYDRDTMHLPVPANEGKRPDIARRQYYLPDFVECRYTNQFGWHAVAASLTGMAGPVKNISTIKQATFPDESIFYMRASLLRGRLPIG